MRGNSFYLGGRTRVFPSDFIVEEIWEDSICEIGYSLPDRLRDLVLGRIRKRRDYIHFTLIKQNWDTIRALNYIGRKVHVSLKRFGISGMKDKRALTSQRVSLWRCSREALIHLKLPDMGLKDFEYSDERITLGNAVGNRFTIAIRDIPKTNSEIVKILDRFGEEVTSKGVPNYYGPQRFSGGNAEIGDAITDGDLQRGTRLILQKVQPYLKKDGIESIPKVFWYEKRLLRHLREYPNDYAGALRRISKRILRIYTHAYQARIFNEKLGKALLEGRPPQFITTPGFSVQKMPELGTYSIKRRSFLVAKDFRVIKTKNGIATLRFALNKGEYASTLLSHLVDTE